MPVRSGNGGRSHISRRAAILSSGAALTAGFAGCLDSNGETDDDTGNGDGSIPTITLGHGIAAEEPLWLMEVISDELDHWGEAYEAEFIPFSANDERLQAFQAGELQAGTAAAITTIFATESGLPMTVVANVSQCREETFTEEFLVTPDSDIDGLNEESLQDTRIGICAPRSSCDMWAQSAALQAGLEVGTDVEVVVTPFPSMPEAVNGGEVDTAMFPQPFHHTGINETGLEPVFDVIDSTGFEHDLMELWFSTQFLENNGDVVELFLEDYSTAVDRFNDDPESSLEMIAEAGYVETPTELYVDLPYYTYSASPMTESLEEINSLAVDIGWLDEEVSIDHLWDLSYLPD
ncbi:ABC transporter substrate-binding protein [Natrarchaeobius halalkaliphilus]|uniref:ABC transporter substrate-binding protein n=1 Tax=Natrarchaeobius halalkaliphilus TaxID=1679091 RepID=A0A3N6NZ03_9EURY|nr:ABC transporter substrate-binding protein [Natrarchaeobius halalkaliphilus]RQG86716.1 ABC transporter substrate-binding protein [Natrarchaeobius halalkaliphilus]